MNFWSSGDEDGGDGWEDEDSLEDLSEQSLGNNEDGQETEDMAPTVAPQESAPQESAPQDSAGSGVAMGGGLFMGRLTRFIEAVTQPEDEEKDDAEGWHDSSQSLGLDDEEDGWGDDAQFDELVEDTPQMQVEPAAASAVALEPAGDPTKSMLMNSGWEEDLDLSGLISPVKEEPARQPPPPPPPSQIDPPPPDFFIPLKGELDMVVVDHTPADNSRYNRNVSFDASLAVLCANSNHTLEDVGAAAQSDAALASTSVDSSGWDEDDGLLDDVENIDVEAAPPPTVDHTPPTPPPSPPQQPQPSTTTFTTESALAPTESSGWDDDGDLDVGDDDAEIADEPSAQMVDHTPPPPPPPPPAGRMTTEATTSTVTSGYQSDNEESKIEKVVDHTPPPLATTNTEAGTAAAATDRAVATAEWDDEDDFFDSVEDQEPVVDDQPHEVLVAVEPLGEPNAVDHTNPPPPPPQADVRSTALGGNSEVPVAKSQAESSGWDEDDGIDVDMEADPISTVKELPTPPTKLVDNLPPPPPPPAPDARSTALGANSQAAVATNSQEDCSGWDEDDDIDAIHVDIDNKKAEDGLTTTATKLVDHTPPPPPPPPPQSDTRSTALGVNSQAAAAINSQADSAGWDEDDDIDINDIDSDSSGKDKSQKLVDQTPPPPPPPRFGRMTTMDAVANGGEDIDDDDISRADTLSVCNSQRATAAPRPPPSGESLGWKDDDEILDTVVEGVNVVDHTPRPSLSRMRRSETSDAVASNLSVMSSIDGSSKISYRPPGDSENLVDHTPNQPPYRLQRSETNDAVASRLSLESPTEVDAINSRQGSGEGWDDVSDIMETGISAQKQTNRKVVDQTPAARASFNRDSLMDSSLLVGAGTSVGGSTLESVGETSDRQEPLRLRTMVDHTPATPTTSARFNRGVSLDASLAAMGASSVGESLDSIHEEGEEIDSDPETAKSGEVGIPFEEDTEAKTYSISFQNSMVIPFGASSPPAEMPHAARMVNTFDMGRVLPLVDHTPVPLVNMRSVTASVDVLSQSSEEDDLGGSTDSVDDVQDELYGNVVDHTPVTPKASKDKVEGSSTDLKLEDDTIVGVASKVGLDADIQEDDEMDDESSHGTSTIGASAFGDHDMRSLVGSVRLAVVEEKHLVDHVPVSESKVQARRTDASTLVLADASSDSSHVDDNIVNDDETARSGFGPIVDHTPSVMQRSARSAATSVVTQITGYETDMKLDEDLDNTIGAAASTDNGGDEAWDHDEPDLEEPMGASDEKHLVDHVPKQRSIQMPVDGSTKVVAIPSDDSTHIDTIAEDSPANFGPVVDHTPLGARPSEFSVAASLLTNANGLEADMKQDEEMDNTMQGGSTDADSGWDHEEPDLDEISTPGDQPVVGQAEEGHVVDHVPEQGQSGSKPTDSSIMALVNHLDAVSVVGDELNGENARSSRFGLVVDQTPAPRSTQLSVATSMATHVSAIDTVVKQDDDMDGTWFGASTAGGASSGGPSSRDESSAGGDGWGDDNQALDEIALVGDRRATAVQADENHLVDHVPSLASLRPTDASTAVVVDPSVVSSQANEENNDENIDAASFGAVVDHTPSEPQPSVYSATTSMATHVTAGLENDIKEDEEMDESIWNGGVSTVDAEGWDQNEPELEELADVHDDQLPHLVDHVPERPESRPTDASTFVVADASEMLSEVDDFGQDEQIFGQQIFGPVVDQTPPSQLAVPHSVAGSTIVVPPSVLDDDLDDAVETAGDGDDQNGWDNDMDTIDEAPNPQSGNEQETNREQLVDYVPPEQEEEIPELVRDGSSEMATVGEKSVFPADDPKEDEFGPVVDHTPILDRPPSPISERIVREESKRNDSSPSDVQRMDSIAAIFSVASKDKDDGLDEDEFGPVVDHLPTVSSRSSLTPSRGGSTVDARATVSEVDADDDDLIGGDGWEEEEIDIDAPQQISSMAASRPTEQSEDRNLSVTWVDTLDEEDAAAFRQKRANTSSHSAGNSDFFDAEMGDTSGISLNATRYYDPEVGDENAWNASLNFDDGDADAPPSTPRLSVDSRDLDNIERGLFGSLEAAIATKEVESIPNTVTSGGVSCKGCSDASTADCPCVKRLLEANGGKDSMVGKFRTPEGEYVKVDFEKLLQDEITKRCLIEKEFQALHSTIESLKSSKRSVEESGKSQIDVLNKLHRSNQKLTDDLTHAHDECNKLRNDSEEFRSERSDLKDELSAWESKQDKWRDDGSSFRKEIQDARQTASDAAAAASRDFGSRELELKSEVMKVEQSNEKLFAQVAKFESDNADLSGKNESLSSELASSRVSLTGVEEERSTLQCKEAALNAEIQHLKSSLEIEAKASSSDAQLKKQISLIQAELATTTGDCVELKSRMSSLQQKLQTAEAGNSKHTKEMANISKQHDQDSAGLKTQLNALQDDLEKARLAMARSDNDFKAKLAQETDVVKSLRQERVLLEKERQQIAAVHELDLKELEGRVKQKEAELRSTSTQLRTLEQEKVKLTSDLSKQVQLAKKSDSLTLESLSLSRERDVLQEALIESKETIVGLQKQAREHASEADGIASRQELEISALNQERETWIAKVDSSKQQAQSFMGQLGSLTANKTAMQKELKEMQAKYSAAHAEAEREKLLAIKDGVKKSKMQQELESLRCQVHEASGDRQAKDGKLNELFTRCSDFESELQRVQAESRSHQADSEKVKLQLIKEREHSNSINAGNDLVTRERDELIARCHDLESVSSDALSNANQQAAHMSLRQHDLDSLTAQRDKLEEDHATLELALSEKQDRIAALKLELTESEKLLANKDHVLVIMKEQQRASHSGFQDVQKENKMLKTAVEELEKKIADFDGERTRLNKLVAKHATNEKSYNDKLASAISEKEAFAQEHAMLDEENEEMLVQLGLLKEQMDDKDAGLQRMQEEVEISELTAQEADIKRQDAEKHLEELTNASNVNGSNNMLAASEMEESMQQILQEKSILKSEVFELNLKNEDVTQLLELLESEKEELLNLVADLESKVTQVVDSSETKEKQLVAVIEDMEMQRKDLSQRFHGAEVNLDRVNEKLRESQVIVQEATALRDRVVYLENTLSDQQRALDQKDGALQDLQYQLRNAGQAPQASAELSTLRETIRNMEVAADEDRTRIRELESICRTTREELRATQENLSAAESSLYDLEMDLDSRKQVEESYAKMGSRLHSVESELSEKTKDVARFEKESKALRSQVTNLESELNNARRASSQAARESTSQSAAELHALRAQIQSLQEQRNASSSETDASAAHIEREVQALQQTMTSKDSQISTLKRQLQSLGGDLSASHQGLAAKQEDVHRLSSELEELRTQANRPVTSQVLELTQDEAESGDKMRSHIVSLAHALEQAENRRAEAIERLEKERQANADSLRRLTESVKRFYSTLSFGDV